jgi:hypothetical protein
MGKEGRRRQYASALLVAACALNCTSGARHPEDWMVSLGTNAVFTTDDAVRTASASLTLYTQAGRRLKLPASRIQASSPAERTVALSA